MLLRDEILTLLKQKELSAKQLSEAIPCKQKSLYRPLDVLEKNGFIGKSEKVVQGKRVCFYSSLGKKVGQVCTWEQLKQTFIQNKIYPENILENDYSDQLRADFRKVKEETQVKHILLIGEVGNGKSITALELGGLLTPSFSIRDVFFNLGELLDRIDQRPKKRTLLMDDAGRMIGNRWWQDQATEKRKLWEYSQICREHRVNLIATVPNMKFVDQHFLRLIGYVFHVCLQCEDKGHAHAVVEKTVPIRTGATLMPVGVLRLDYPHHLQPFIDEYKKKKTKAMEAPRRDIARDFEKAKKLVHTYIEGHIITRVNKTIIGFALYGSGLAELPDKEIKELIKLGSEILAEKKERISKQEQLQEKIKKEQEKQAQSQRNLFDEVYYAYRDKGRSEQFAKAVAYRLIYKNRLNLKNLEKAMSPLEKIIDPALVELLVLSSLDDNELIFALKKLEELFGKFCKGLPIDLSNRLFKLLLSRPTKFEELITGVGLPTEGDIFPSLRQHKIQKKLEEADKQVQEEIQKRTIYADLKKVVEKIRNT